MGVNQRALEIESFELRYLSEIEEDVRAEYLAQLAVKYEVQDGETIDPETGVITRLPVE